MRVEGWEQLLNEHVEQARDIEFAWGSADCALWSADWVRKATGEDFSSPWRGRYATEAELTALLGATGVAGPEGVADAALPRADVPFARRGDLVLWQGCLGICNGLVSHFLMERGVTAVKTRNCTAAWAVR